MMQMRHTSQLFQDQDKANHDRTRSQLGLQASYSSYREGPAPGSHLLSMQPNGLVNETTSSLFDRYRENQGLIKSTRTSLSRYYEQHPKYFKLVASELDIL